MLHTFPTLKTNRLVLREVLPEDATSVLAYLSDEQVVKQMGLDPFQSEADALEEIDWYASIRRDGTGIRFGIALQEDDVIIGSCGFLNQSARHQRAELGFELSPAYQGQGIAKEAALAVITYGFEELSLNRIEALVLPANTASHQLLERLGFQREGLLRQYEKTRGQFDDLYMYSILRSEWSVKDLTLGSSTLTL
ncbi:alanine acetyltransferase [Exiguobacterium indicum]|uniref:Alanine acetyltransferase n=1 Tax=Exiguobacterium indicum TaxID=296995 RepID=A0AAW3MEA8_9BACL|nr:GNAT family protein [Exiguobacterium indicum]KTR27154.1 alanine acetyltransferase [Exiguobacterium indicum]